MDKDNLIVIKGGSHSDIKKALQQWIELYSDDLETDIKFEFYKIGHESHLIVADKRLNNEKFNYLVNYLCYPENIEYKISIEGYTTANAEKLYSEKILNKRLLIYISENDKEFDNVFVTTENNETYKVDFGGKITRLIENKTFKIPDIDFDALSRPDIITLKKTEIEGKKKEKLLASIENRFKIILFIIIALSAINFLSLFVIENSDINTVTTYLLGFGIGGWLISDYEILQIRKYYNYCFILAIAILCYGFMIRHFSHYDNYISNFGYLFPLILLIIQKPLRLIYIRKFKKEPVVEREAPIFWDGIYSVILFLSTMVIIFAIMEVMK